MFGSSLKFPKLFAIRSAVALLLTASTVAVVACDGALPTAPTATPAVTLVGEPGAYALGADLGGLVTGLTCAINGSVSKLIGPEGGTISLGGITLDIPSHSLSKLTTIILVPIPGAAPQVQFFPEGLVFNEGRLPRLSFNTDCIGNPANPVIVYTDNTGKILEKLNSYSNGHSVWANIKHFSRYAVDW